MTEGTESLFSGGNGAECRRIGEPSNGPLCGCPPGTCALEFPKREGNVYEPKGGRRGDQNSTA